MRKIQKTYSLEPMTSRVPSIWPSYKNNTLYFFDDASLNARDYIYPSNYGMIPLNISFSSNTENDTVEYGLDCSSAATTISFERLSNWYYFFNEYYRLLNDYGHCNRTYSSAQEYYRYESNTKYANQMIYGSDEQTYINEDHIVCLKDLTLNFDPDDTESEALSKIIFSNGLSILISQSDASSLRSSVVK